MLAEEIMTPNPIALNENATLAEALEVLSSAQIRHLPVLRGGEVVGMLSDRELQLYGYSTVTDMESLDEAKQRLSLPVSQVMSADLVTIERETDVREVIDLLAEEKIGAVPVVDTETGQLQGIVSYIDVLNAVRGLLD